ncbi:hypothetical protein LPJ53_002219 [Coemansia erecta]|uniref:BTB domain-containing protein n=1 Tax=Coemansia erecta TaxID=147472 RepID=A0A9W7Y3Q3_9FUNG|nr:hypothetical protein LPJ53_002219 [Coemansia erecta]
MSTPAANSEAGAGAGAGAQPDSLLGPGGGRATTVDFGELRPQYHAPMMFPNEVELYEPTLQLADGGPRPAAAAAPSAGAAGSVRTVQTQVDVALPCGYFNVWRPLHERRTAICARLQRFMVGAAAAAGDAGTPGAWSSRVSYSSADDEYFQNGVALAFVKGWQRGALHARNVFRKVEHDWGMAYLAPTPRAAPAAGLPQAGVGDRAVVVWRFNYAESHGVVDALHVRAGFAVFSEQAAVRWHIRRLDRPAFERVAVHELTADELASFPEAAGAGVEATSAGAAQRARVVERHRGSMLAYRVHGDAHNAYALLSLPGFAADLSRHVAGAYGFELAAELQPAREGADRWQKAQVARQSLLRPVNGRMREGEAALERCGLDVRVRLRPDVAVDRAAPAAGVRMDDAAADFVVRVADPSNTVGSLQPPVRAHAHVLAAGSDYFAALLASAMSETAARSVVLEDMPYGAARVALSFLYSGAVADADTRPLGGWLALLAVAARLAIPRLHQLCQARILQHAMAAVAAEVDAAEPGAGTAMPDAAERQLRPAAAALFARLHAAAAENGADALADALDRIVANYAVACQEHAMRCGDTAPYAPPPPAGHGHGHIGFDPAHDDPRHLHLVPGMLVRPGPHGMHAFHDEGDNGDEDDEDDGELGRRADGQGFFARLFGHGWHVTNADDQPPEPPQPPQPQPGPVAHAEARSDAQSDSGSETHSHT